MASIPLISILLFRYILPGAEYITGVGIVISKKTIYTSLALAAAVIANLLATLILTPHYGILGAAFAETAGFLVGGIVIYLVSQRLYPVDWNLRIISLSLLGYTGIAILSVFLLRARMPLVWFTLLRIALLSAYAAFLWQLIEHDQRKMLSALPGQVYGRVIERIRASMG
jgi:O-antigen/teichoic acid export membrane protein